MSYNFKAYVFCKKILTRKKKTRIIEVMERKNKKDDNIKTVAIILTVFIFTLPLTLSSAGIISNTGSFWLLVSIFFFCTTNYDYFNHFKMDF